LIDDKDMINIEVDDIEDFDLIDVLKLKTTG